MDCNSNTAPYRIISDAGGNRYRFFCESSGIAVCVTSPITGATPEQELLLAWESEGRKHFNRCRICGKWVSDVMYNVDTLQCVDCSPWEDEPVFCFKCGTRKLPNQSFCKKCGAKLMPEGGDA